MSDAPLPVLYSFRRCPYAIRARLALRYAGVRVGLREVVLKDKPTEMVDGSPKATVPVLVLDEGGEQQKIIDESFDIMLWALAQNDPDAWLDVDAELLRQLIDANDNQFKPWLDRYKYPNHYDDLQAGEPRERCEEFLHSLEQRLQAHAFLCGDRLSLMDMSIYPFVRQFVSVDRDWFNNSPYVELRRWLQAFLDSPLFVSVMDKYPQWHTGDADVPF